MSGATLERRAAALEVRASGRRLEGYAATFGTVANLGAVAESIAPGAFAAALAAHDVLALLDHDAGKVLGRTRNRTLRLAEDSKGLSFSLDLPETQAGRDVLALAERGDLGGMSFGFTVPQGGDEWQGNKRTLRAIDLREVSIVSAWPAYPQTSISVRSPEMAAHHARRARMIVLMEAGR